MLYYPIKLCFIALNSYALAPLSQCLCRAIAMPSEHNTVAMPSRYHSHVVNNAFSRQRGYFLLKTRTVCHIRNILRIFA